MPAGAKKYQSPSAANSTRHASIAVRKKKTYLICNGNTGALFK